MFRRDGEECRLTDEWILFWTSLGRVLLKFLSGERLKGWAKASLCTRRRLRVSGGFPSFPVENLGAVEAVKPGVGCPPDPASRVPCAVQMRCYLVVSSKYLHSSAVCKVLAVIPMEAFRWCRGSSVSSGRAAPNPTACRTHPRYQGTVARKALQLVRSPTCMGLLMRGGTGPLRVMQQTANNPSASSRRQPSWTLRAVNLSNK